VSEQVSSFTSRLTHFRDESFREITCTGTDNSKQTREYAPETKRNHFWDFNAALKNACALNARNGVIKISSEDGIVILSVIPAWTFKASEDDDDADDNCENNDNGCGDCSSDPRHGQRQPAVCRNTSLQAYIRSHRCPRAFTWSQKVTQILFVIYAGRFYSE